LTGEPEYRLLFWKWDNQKLIANIHITDCKCLYKCSFSVIHEEDFLVVGNEALKLFHYVEGKVDLVRGDLNGIPSYISKNFLSHTWTVNGCIIVGTSKGFLNRRNFVLI